MGRLRVTKAKKSTAKKNATPQEVFAKLWKQVQNEQLILEQLPAQIEEFYTLYREKLGPLEAKWCELQQAEIELLLTHWQRKSLTTNHRFVFVEYIAAAFEELRANPFCTLDISALELKVRDILLPAEAEDDEDNDLFGDKSSDEKKSKKQKTKDDTADFFKMDDDESDFFNDEEDEFDDFFDDHVKHAQDMDKEEASELFNATSLNKMFRQLSKVLHPDLEQDEEQKILKHDLMAQLLAARDKQDVGTIVALYSQHIGGDGAQFSQEDFPRLTVLLKKQLRDMQKDKLQLAMRAGMPGFIYERYHYKTPARQKNAFNARQSVLEIMCDDIEYSLRSNKTIKNVKQFLSNWENEQIDTFLSDLF